ncbi:hypothetical protein BZK31_26610 [Pseudomonas floridensis]|uniref:Uncharacterized protein n=1 Tax=Pseudomonas floridensis TaxID=1958950 RepID=A0A1X0MYG7_9PSED|nr:hypothetical protein BZK31_26610 [Pseudomonas floridensis]
MCFGLFQCTIPRSPLMLGVHFLESIDNAFNRWGRTGKLAADLAVAGLEACCSCLTQTLIQKRFDVHIVYAMSSTSDRVMPSDLPTTVMIDLAGQTIALPTERIVGLQATADDAIRAGITPYRGSCVRHDESSLPQSLGGAYKPHQGVHRVLSGSRYSDCQSAACANCIMETFVNVEGGGEND